MTKILLEHTYSSGQIIRVVQGALDAEDSDAVVNAANPKLQHEKGMSKSLVRRGGSIIQQESDKLIQESGPLQPGRAVITRAGNLSAKFIIHAIGPTRTSKNKEYLLIEAIQNSLSLADSYNLQKISIPILSAYALPKDVSVKLIVRTALKYLRRNSTSTLKEVRFCSVDGMTAKIFLEKTKELLSQHP